MNKTKNYLREIEVLIRARYPVIYIQSWEEQRVQEWLMKVAKARSKHVYEWSFSTGIVNAGTESSASRTRASATQDPVKALDEVIAQIEPAIYIFKDLHPFLTQNNFGGCAQAQGDRGLCEEQLQDADTAFAHYESSA